MRKVNVLQDLRCGVPGAVLGAVRVPSAEVPSAARQHALDRGGVEALEAVVVGRVTSSPVVRVQQRGGEPFVDQASRRDAAESGVIGQKRRDDLLVFLGLAGTGA